MEHPLNAHPSIRATGSGIVIDVSPSQLEKASSPMLWMLWGIIVLWQPTINLLVDVSIIALQLSRESYTLFELSITIDFKLMQFDNIYSSMLPTALPIIIDCKFVQP